MRTVKYNPTKVPPTWFGMVQPEATGWSLRIRDNDYKFCKDLCERYPVPGFEIGECAALVDHVQISKYHRDSYEAQRHELTRLLEDKDTKIVSLKVKTTKGVVNLEDPEILRAVLHKYKRYPDPLYSKILAELWTYFEIMGLTKYQIPTAIGYIFDYCKINGPKGKPLKTESEWDDSDHSDSTYRAYLKNTVNSWMQTIRKKL
jgi:hypothetical protein